MHACFMCVFVAHTCVCFVYIPAFKNVCVYLVYIHAYRYFCAYVSMHAFMYTTHTHLYVCMHACGSKGDCKRERIGCRSNRTPLAQRRHACMYIHYICTHTHVCLCLCASTQVQTLTQTDTKYTHTCMYVQTLNTHTRACMYVCMHY